MSLIHSTAIIDKTAILHENVSVGPYSIIGPNVSVGKNTKIGSHVCIVRDVEIGENNIFYQACSIGNEPQDLTKKGVGKLIIGSNNTFREYVNIHLPTVEGGFTKVGSGCYFMANVHVAHDCIIGNNVILVNYAGISGFSQIDDGAFLSGYATTHQFCRVGSYAIVALSSKITQDVPPYIMTSDHKAKAHGINSVGLKRAGITLVTRTEIKKAFKILYHDGLTIPNALAKIENEMLSKYIKDSDEYLKIKYFVDFCKNSKRGLISASFSLDKNDSI